MLKVPLNEVKDDLSRFLRLAETENVIITRHGVPAGMLVGFENPEDWWEALLLRDDRFLTRISEARASLQAGEGISLEEFKAQQTGKSAAKTKAVSTKKTAASSGAKTAKRRKAVSRQIAT